MPRMAAANMGKSPSLLENTAGQHPPANGCLSQRIAHCASVSLTRSGERDGSVRKPRRLRFRFACCHSPLRGNVQMATVNAEDYKQGAKIGKTTVSRGGCVGTLLKIPLC